MSSPTPLSSPFEAISPEVASDSLNNALTHVFDTMLSEAVKMVPESEKCVIEKGGPRVVATVGFAGDITGLIHLHMSDHFANETAARMLSMPIAEIEADVSLSNDAVGEIANMVAGQFKNRLVDLGFPCKLTLPTIVRGRDFSIQQLRTTNRMVRFFDCRNERLAADVIARMG